MLGGYGSSTSRNLAYQAGSSALVPCVYAFSKDYDIDPTYLPFTNESAQLRVDSTFLPDPQQGWFGLGSGSPPIIALNYFQTAPWFHVAIDPNASDAEFNILGTRSKAKGINSPSIARRSTNETSALLSAFESTILKAVASTNNSDWTGLLGQIETTLFVNLTVNNNTFTNYLQQLNSSNSSSSELINSLDSLTVANFSHLGIELTSLQPLPWFDQAGPSTEDSLDNQLTQDILDTLDLLISVNATGFGLSYRAGSIYEYPQAALTIQAITNMPWGNVLFHHARNGSLGYTIQIGSDARLSNLPSYPTEGLRRMA